MCLFPTGTLCWMMIALQSRCACSGWRSTFIISSSFQMLTNFWKRLFFGLTFPLFLSNKRCWLFPLFFPLYLLKHICFFGVNKQIKLIQLVITYSNNIFIPRELKIHGILTCSILSEHNQGKLSRGNLKKIGTKWSENSRAKCCVNLIQDSASFSLSFKSWAWHFHFYREQILLS